MKLFAIIALACALSGCGLVQRFFANVKGSEQTCINGVSYLQFPSGATVEVDANGKPKTCIP